MLKRQSSGILEYLMQYTEGIPYFATHSYVLVLSWRVIKAIQEGGYWVLPNESPVHTRRIA